MECAEKTKCIACGLATDPIIIPPVFNLPQRLLPAETCRRCRQIQESQAYIERDRILANSRIAKSGIPPRFNRCSFENYHPSEVNKRSYKLICGFDPSLGSTFMFGGPGTGKTHLSVAILRRWLTHSDGVFISVPDLLFEIKKSFFNGGYFQLSEKFRQIPLLVLDDIGAERLTMDEEKQSFARETLFGLINSRYQAKKSIVFTSNFQKDDLETKLGKPLVSRIIEMCSIVPFQGQDYRFKIRNEAVSV